MRRLRHFVAAGPGRFRPQLRSDEQDLLRRLPSEVSSLLGTGHPSARRLAPVAYVDDPAAEADYQRTVGGALLDSRRQALQTLAATVDDPVIDEPTLEQWLQALEALRLVLGTHLDVTEDMDLPPPNDPRALPLAVYHFLSALQDEAVLSLSALLPEGPDEDDGARL
ncbi:MAG: DUF2017 family protein [Actinomycetota bacterium]|nr:DUF2017 family protein [Actinomycetota bacterium]